MLVREKRIAASVNSDTNYPGVRAPNLFVLTATPLAPHTTAEVEAAIYEELERLKTEPVSAKELEKVLNNLDADLVRALRSNGGLASQLAFYQTVAGDWRYVLKARDRIAAVTPADMQRVAAAVFHQVEPNRGSTWSRRPEKKMAATAPHARGGAMKQREDLKGGNVKEREHRAEDSVISLRCRYCVLTGSRRDLCAGRSQAR